jgi:TRAP-type uncharacterized transport system substrate-binding protein
MKRVVVVLLAIGLILSFSYGYAQTKKRISIATGGTGGVYYPYGGAIASVISKYIPGVEATAEVTAAAVDNLKLIPTDGALPKVFEKYGQVYVKANIPKTAYPKMTGDVGVVGIPNVLVCNANADSDLIYKIVKAMFDHKADLVAVHKQASEFTLDSAVIKTVVPYHPGAVKYFKEKGMKM